MDTPPKQRPTASPRRKTLLFSALALTVLALALGLGLGLGLTLGRDDSSGDDNGSSPTSSPSPLPSPNATLPWTPRAGASWQIVLQSGLDLSASATSVTPDVDIYDIDLFENSAETIGALQRMGKKVICYFSAGSFEKGRPDAGEFEEGDMGRVLDGWPDERWLRLGSANVRRIMRGRVELAGRKGCDGVDPDNVDGYQNDNGLHLTANDSISFMQYLSSLTTPLNLTLGLKNAGDIIPAVLPIVHFSVNEQCVDESECDTFHPFITAGKPVFHIEYPDGAGAADGLKKNVVHKYCSGQGDAKGSDGFSTVLKNMDLDGWVEYCDEDVRVTAVNQTGSAN